MIRISMSVMRDIIDNNKIDVKNKITAYIK